MPGQDDGKIVVMSWHIHYNTITGDQERFYEVRLLICVRLDIFVAGVGP